MQTPLNVEVSSFEYYHSPDSPRPVNLLDWLQSDCHKTSVEQIRATTDKIRRDALKSRLPCITPSGTFSRRSNSALIWHSGLICLDIDGKDNQHIGNFAQLKAELCKIVNVAYCGLSVSGAGYFLLIPLLYPQQHKSHFEALKEDFSRYSIILDASCGDVSRLRGYSYDPDAYINHQPITYTRLFERKPRSPPIRHLNAPTPVGQTQQRVERTIREITARQLDITGGYQQWFQIGSSLANEFGEAGRSYFHQVSQYHADYDPAKTDRQFSQCLTRAYSFRIGTFFKFCKDAGIGYLTDR